VREVYRRYVQDGESISRIARSLSERGIPTATGKVFWERSTVWRILRNPAYRGQAAFGKKHVTGERTKATRRVRVRGERHGLAPRRAARPAEEWISIPVPAIVSDETFERA
jgi:site-specific DNA recombinase